MASHPSNAVYRDASAVSYDEQNAWVSVVNNDLSLYIWDVKDIRKVRREDWRNVKWGGASQVSLHWPVARLHQGGRHLTAGGGEGQAVRPKEWGPLYQELVVGEKNICFIVAGADIRFSLQAVNLKYSVLQPRGWETLLPSCLEWARLRWSLRLSVLSQQRLTACLPQSCERMSARAGASGDQEEEFFSMETAIGNFTY